MTFSNIACLTKFSGCLILCMLRKRNLIIPRTSMRRADLQVSKQKRLHFEYFQAVIMNLTRGADVDAFASQKET